MRGLVVAWAAVGVCLAVGAGAAAGQPPAGLVLGRTLRADISHANRTSGVDVLDLTTGRTVFSSLATVGRMPASVEKLYTTSTALLRFGPNARLTTSVLGVGSVDADHGFDGILYLKGGGDPTFGSQSFDNYAYGSGATMQRLVANLISQTGITSVHGAIVGDESYLDSLRGTPPYGDRAAPDIEGVLSALAYNRGLANPQGTAFQNRPALFATRQFAAALRAAGVEVPAQTRIYTGPTPASATPLAVVHSPKMSWLIQATNTPSDNFFAEMLLKDLGAAFGGAGTTAAGAAVVSTQIATTFGLRPQIEDGSGLSRYDQTSPLDVVTLLKAMAGNATFTNSLAVAGETGTMRPGLAGTAAQGRCRGKTGTLRDAANLVGYCTARDGHTLAFAFLMNGVDPTAGHVAENRMAVALTRYTG